MQNLEETFPFLIGPAGEILEEDNKIFGKLKVGYVRGFEEGGYYNYNVGSVKNLIKLDDLKQNDKYNKEVDNGEIV